MTTKRIQGHVRTIRELLHGARYTVDFYQREYAWKERQVRELVDDLTSKFLDFHEPSHSRREVGAYGHYFLGSIVISHKNGKRYIVDGQQRLTSLTLLLIFLHHKQKELPGSVDVRNLIYSEKYGEKEFNLDVPERTKVMQCLFDGQQVDVAHMNESSQNIAARYANIAEHFPEEVDGKSLPYFVDWLLENVHFVEIEAYSDEDAYTIFETMNDRGLSLSLPEMLKGYVLANIVHEGDQRKVNETWKSHMQSLKEFGDEEDSDFFKNWLRAKYAETIRPGKKGAQNKDYERVGTEFHRWIQDRKDRLELTDSDAFVRFVERDLDFYARQALAVRRATQTLTPGWESVRFVNDLGFTLQTQMLLAPLNPDDSPADVQKKIALVADFLDIWLARRVWCFRTISYSSVRYSIFTLTRGIRGLSVQDLSAFLRDQLDQQPETFASQLKFRLHKQNYRHVRHILARLTYWVDSQCGVSCNYDDLISEGRARPFEIEHIWADKYDRFADWFSHPSEFDMERNRVGGLLLLQRGINQSVGDAPYENKRNAYLSHSQNLLARSLHPLAYQNNPAFAQFIKRTGLAFTPYDHFGLEEQAQRQQLYLRIAEWVWNPARLDLDGEKPPIHEPLYTEKVTGSDSENITLHEETYYNFWTVLLDYANTQSDLHANRTPIKTNTIRHRRHGARWIYTVLKHNTRIELYMSERDRTNHTTAFDQLFAQRAAIESHVGTTINWVRDDTYNGSSIHLLIDGGWADEHDWTSITREAVDAMQRLYRAIAPHLAEDVVEV